MSATVSRIVKLLKERTEELVLGHGPFGEEEGQFLFEELLKEENRHVSCIVLSTYYTSEEGIRWLGKLVEKSSVLKTFSVARKILDGDLQLELMRAITGSTSLETVRLQNAALKVAAALFLVRQSKTVRGLDLYANDMCDGAAAVVESALEHKRITDLSVSQNSLSQRLEP